MASYTDIQNLKNKISSTELLINEKETQKRKLKNTEDDYKSTKKGLKNDLKNLEDTLDELKKNLIQCELSYKVIHVMSLINNSKSSVDIEILKEIELEQDMLTIAKECVENKAKLENLENLKDSERSEEEEYQYKQTIEFYETRITKLEGAFESKNKLRYFN